MRVLSFPTHHPYVDHVCTRADGTGTVTRLDAPTSSPSGTPPAMTTGWLAGRLPDVDLVHVHFGFDAVPVADLRAWCALLADSGRPLVLTVHDLRNPHHDDPRHHDDQLDVLVPAATTVVTLTDSAAQEVRSRWRRPVVVLPHPHLLDVARLGDPTRRRDGDVVVGLHLKSLRRNSFGGALVDALIEAVDPASGVRLRVDLHREVLDRGFPRPDPVLLQGLQQADDAGRLELRVHDRYDDDQLVDYLRGLDVSVLANRFGTHSGWVELCHDVGTAVLAARTGHWHSQRPLHGFDVVDGRPDASSVRRALADAIAAGRPAPASAHDRIRQRDALVDAHEQIYRRAVAETAVADTAVADGAVAR